MNPLRKNSGQKKLLLKVEIDPYSGYCPGVKKTIQKAEELLESDNSIFCLGEIVHNEEEVRRLENKGMVTINKKDLQEIHHQKILFRAHGEPPLSYASAASNDNEIIDASCPVVLSLQKKIRKAWERGEKIYIYGKREHPEIIGLAGQINDEAAIFENTDDLDIKSIRGTISLFSQTTMDLNKYKRIIRYFENQCVSVKVYDTICRQVTGRQPKLKNFCKQFDKVIFVAGKHSSNGKVLFSICRSHNPDSFYISNTEEIQKRWFSVNDRVGISGGTSTPMWLMENVKELLESF